MRRGALTGPESGPAQIVTGLTDRHCRHLLQRDDASIGAHHPRAHPRVRLYPQSDCVELDCEEGLTFRAVGVDQDVRGQAGPATPVLPPGERRSAGPAGSSRHPVRRAGRPHPPYLTGLHPHLPGLHLRTIQLGQRGHGVGVCLYQATHHEVLRRYIGAFACRGSTVRHHR